MRLVLLVLIAACHHGSSGPPATSCATLSDHVYAMLPQDDHGKSVRDVFGARCVKDGWSTDTRACIMDTKTLHDGHHCKDRLTPEQRSAFELDLEIVEKKRAAQIPPECERYRLAMVKIAACDKLPRSSRDALQQGFEAMSHGWASYENQSPDARRTMIAGCRQALEAIEQIGKSICGM